MIDQWSEEAVYCSLVSISLLVRQNSVRNQEGQDKSRELIREIRDVSTEPARPGTGTLYSTVRVLYFE